MDILSLIEDMTVDAGLEQLSQEGKKTDGNVEGNLDNTAEDIVAALSEDELAILEASLESMELMEVGEGIESQMQLAERVEGSLQDIIGKLEKAETQEEVDVLNGQAEALAALMDVKLDEGAKLSLEEAKGAGNVKKFAMTVIAAIRKVLAAVGTALLKAQKKYASWSAIAFKFMQRKYKRIEALGKKAIGGNEFEITVPASLYDGQTNVIATEVDKAVLRGTVGANKKAVEAMFSADIAAEFKEKTPEEMQKRIGGLLADAVSGMIENRPESINLKMFEARGINFTKGSRFTPVLPGLKVIAIGWSTHMKQEGAYKVDYPTAVVLNPKISEEDKKGDKVVVKDAQMKNIDVLFKILKANNAELIDNVGAAGSHLAKVYTEFEKTAKDRPEIFSREVNSYYSKMSQWAKAYNSACFTYNTQVVRGLDSVLNQLLKAVDKVTS